MGFVSIYCQCNEWSVCNPPHERVENKTMIFILNTLNVLVNVDVKSLVYV